MKRFLAAVIILFASAAAFGAPPKTGEPVKEVRVRGNLRVETAKILSVVKTATGAPFDPDQVRGDITAIYGLGYFADALVEYDEEGRLTFVLLERPALRRWELKENDVVRPDDTKDKINLEVAEILRDGAAEEGARQLKELMLQKGYYLSKVDYEVVPVEGGKNQVDLYYTVDPGEKVRIRRIHLPGATEDQIEEVKSGMAMSEKTSWSWLTDSGAFRRAELLRDAEWIRIHYLNNGYAQVVVGEPVVQVTPDQLHIEISIPVETGIAYHIDRVTFEGDSQFEAAKLLEAVKIKPGDLFTADSIRASMEALTALHADEGYAYVQINPIPRNFTPGGLVELTFDIRKGDVYTIGRIETSGNDYTRDNVIRREMRLAEGDRYSHSLMQRSDKALKRLGYFKDVTINEMRRTGEPVLDLNIGVEEQMTGSFSMGAGYSSYDGFMITGSVSKSNLFGYGYQLRADANLSENKQSYSVTFNDPRLFDTDVFAGFDVYKTSQEYTEYDKESVGFRARLGKAFGEDWHGRLTYELDDSTIKNVCTAEKLNAGLCDFQASVLVQDQVGKTTTSSITPMVYYDTRNNYLDPTEGNYTSGSILWAGGLLGGDADYLIYNLDARHHLPLFTRSSFMVRGRAGYIDSLSGEEVPVYERFSLGGISTVRGFNSRSIGPLDPGVRDPVTQKYIRDPSGEVVGGDKFAVFNAEYVFPIFDEVKIKGVVFYDAGNAWSEGKGWFSTRLRDSAGYGIRWFSPVGPLRLEYGVNLNPRPDEPRSRWDFLIGGYF